MALDASLRMERERVSDTLRRTPVHFARRMMVDVRFELGDVRALLETPR